MHACCLDCTLRFFILPHVSKSEANLFSPRSNPFTHLRHNSFQIIHIFNFVDWLSSLVATMHNNTCIASAGETIMSQLSFLVSLLTMWSILPYSKRDDGDASDEESSRYGYYTDLEWPAWPPKFRNFFVRESWCCLCETSHTKKNYIYIGICNLVWVCILSRFP